MGNKIKKFLIEYEKGIDWKYILIFLGIINVIMMISGSSLSNHIMINVGFILLILFSGIELVFKNKRIRTAKDKVVTSKENYDSFIKLNSRPLTKEELAEEANTSMYSYGTIGNEQKSANSCILELTTKNIEEFKKLSEDVRLKQEDLVRIVSKK